MPPIDLAALADAGAFVSREHQEHLAEAFRLRDLRVEPGAVTFAAADGERTRWRAHFLGSASPDDGTWLWGWRNVNGFPDAFVQQSRRLRAFGEKHAVAQLATPELPLTDELPDRLVRAAKALTGLTAHVVAPTGAGGTRAWMLLEDAALRLPPPTVARTVGVVMGGLGGSDVQGHRRALVAWAEQRAAVVEPGPDGLVRVHVSDGTVRVRFDGEDRIVGISSGRAEPEHAEEPAPPPPEDPPIALPDPVPAESAAPRRGLLSRLLGRG